MGNGGSFQVPQRPAELQLRIVRTDQFLVDSAIGVEGHKAHRAFAVEARTSSKVQVGTEPVDHSSLDLLSHKRTRGAELLQPVYVTEPCVPA